MVPDRIIPVIFVPGVMGSNLKRKGPPDAVWLLDSATTAAPWMTKSAALRKRVLDPDQTEVYGGGKIPSGTAQTEGELQRRGWGEVACMSYAEWLVWLENALNDAHAGTDYGRKGVRESLCRLVTPGLEPLERAEVSLSYKYQFPVHAVGYNWLQSNAVSAQRLAAKIDEFTKYYREKRYRCEKVILVTHSMGGLVARYYSEAMGHRDKVLGVVHGVMPATGAAATYKRMKAGTEGVAGLALGPDAAAMTAVVGNAPGPLQLLPSPEYGMGWLKIRDGEQFIALPRADPYSEIYTVRGAWWGLCDDRLLNPLDPEKKTIARDWSDFENTIKKKVKTFHARISGRYHASTYAFYGDDEKHKEYGDVRWVQQAPSLLRGNAPSLASLLEGRASDDPGTGGQLVKATSGGKPSFGQFLLSDADERGDGTVPVRSGRAPGCTARVCVAIPGIEHEGGYKPDATRRFALWAITRIAQNVKGTSLEYKA
ncbi:esterase/lipase family protein [Paraburkholderia sp. DGU8]|uniref:esterase/lipase family protein n=1 Tax=Paraburkholderia sp. DGU8 TaxID=3161997 RepID=UPI0034670E77